MAEVDKMTRRQATLNIFMLADDERLSSFVDEVAKRNGGRVLRAMSDSLGEFVVSDFLRSQTQTGTRESATDKGLQSPAHRAPKSGAFMN